DEVAAVACLGESADAAGASDLAKVRFTARLQTAIETGLDHTDHAVAADSVIDHFEIARLENIERHAAAGQKQRRRQREHRYDRRNVACPAILPVSCLHRLSLSRLLEI